MLVEELYSDKMRYLTGEIEVQSAIIEEQLQQLPLKLPLDIDV